MASTDFISDDLAILSEFVDESESGLSEVATLFVELESKASYLELVNTIFRTIHSIKGNSAFLGLLQVRTLAHEMESLLDDIRKHRQGPRQEVVNVLLTGVDAMKGILTRIRKQEPEVSDLDAFTQLLDSIRTLQARAATAPATADATAPDAASGVPAPAAAPTPTPAPSPAAEPAPVAPEPIPAAGPQELARTIRVQERHIHAIETLTQRLVQLHQQFQQAGTGPVEECGALLATLQQHLTAMRKVSLRELLQRAPRIGRDVSAALGKTVTVHLAGEELMAPKSLVEALEAPLMHLVRNAVDHGIETPAERRKQGKTPDGHVWVEARETAEALLVRIADDGAGIDFKALLMKAVEQGLCPKGRQLKPEDVTNLIFLPGLSTAKTVTETSGRGVGMDVVKSNVEAVGGKVQVASKRGKGTEFILQLPKN